MTYNGYVTNYINGYKAGEPIYIEVIKEEIKNTFKDIEIEKLFLNINVILNRLVKIGVIKIFYKGIYYKPKTNVFGEMALNRGKVIKDKYIQDKEGNIKGYVCGAKLYNLLGFTTQVPNVIDIVTNECNTKYKYKNKYLGTLIRKPKIRIDNDNYLYLQLFDILENKDNIRIEVENADEIIAKFIKTNKLEYKKIIIYAYKTDNLKLIEKVAKIAM